MMMNRRTIRSAFTIMELLVAITIAMLMLVLIGQVFRSTTSAVTRGAQSAEVLGSHRAASEQFRQDFDNLLSPWFTPSDATDVGYLAIVNHEILADMPKRTGTSNPRGETERVQVRSDQISFIATTLMEGGEPYSLPLTPMDDTTFAASPLARARHQKVWYGHVQRTLPDGTAGLPLGYVNLTDPPSTNGRGWQWPLGRQGMFLLNFVEKSITPSSVTHASGNINAADANAAISGGFINASISDPRAFKGYADLADIPAFYDPLYPAIAPLIGIAGSGARLEAGPSAYRDIVYQLMYVQERLWANISPDSSDGIDSQEVAQMHPVFMPNVSDFAIDFAGDFDSISGIDTDSSTGEIQWYGGYKDLRFGVTQPPTTFFNGSDPSPRFEDGTLGGTVPPLGTHAFIWRHDDSDPATTRWPWLIRIRYRVHDYDGKLTTTIYNQETNTYETVAGRWFEVIVPVKRPAP